MKAHDKRRDEARGMKPGAIAALAEYARKRDFSITAEPPVRGARPRAEGALGFVVQKHAARRLHYDFRLELDGTLKSWAIPKGPSLDPRVKRLAVHVEDHPLDYADFEGRIPQGQYGGGDVIVWDRGLWQPRDPDPAAAYRAGKLSFHLLGEKLSGGWTLVRTRDGGSGDKAQWLLIKDADGAARPQSDYDVVVARPESVLTHAQLPARRDAAGAAGGEGAKKARVAALRGDAARNPAWIAPELATAVEAPPPGEWRYELKFDGYRMLARVENGRARLYTRNHHDWTAKLAPLREAVESLGADSAWLDGEVVVTDAHGVPDFQALQNALELGRDVDLRYFLFDLPYLDGEDLRKLPLEARRARLRALLGAHDHPRLAYSEDFPVPPQDILASACELRIEGVIGKRAGSPYRSVRSTDWIKLKCRQRQEFVIVGYSAPQGGRQGFGALLLAVHDEAAGGRLRYAGKVGSGFSGASLKALHQRMQPLRRPTPALALPVDSSVTRGATWLEPRLLCEVAFAMWTRDGLVRHAVFQGLRDDKPAADAVRERALPATAVARIQGDGRDDEDAPAPTAKVPSNGVRAGARRSPGTLAGVAISNPDRVIDAASGVTKGELATFYCRIGAQLLPHLAGRPLSILRAPTGIDGERFFQRHADKMSMAGVHLLPPDLDPDGERLMMVDTLEGVVGAAQMGTIEFHTWNATADRIERPDRIVFDLDPDPALPWSRMVEATRLVLTLLDEIGLDAFLKTSGGKGIHVVVPLARRHDWEALKQFSRAVTRHLARILPQRFADRMGPQNRVGRIFVDYLRNQRAASTVSAYSVRARPGLAVSVPITRQELERIDGADQWTVRNLHQRLARLTRDPWEGYANRQVISAAMRAAVAAD
ncbi:ATP-dependent DNA ligase [Azoarcus olearius]|uniref:DNA ligase D n=1 Tax=Azoarcus sp. (strain BH72) TaxID=418699 RepID=UPI0008062F67|nr:DNA ligase D [Azoarcus olearius]ANQ84929.1 ATP-dependent DNA ligase [Azoarcus olearius]